MIARISRVSVASTSGGVPSGAPSPTQEAMSKPGYDSAIVGTCGRIDRRSLVVTATTRNRPPSTSGRGEP